MTDANESGLAEIVIDAIDPSTMELWRTVAKVAATLEQADGRWCLVGGLMVALFALEAGQQQRVTTDIDILGDARRRPSGTEWVTKRLQDLGATRHEISGFESEKGFRFAVHGQTVDVLAPDGLRTPPKVDAQFTTIQIPGGSQALRRSEVVAIVVDGTRALLRRPTLLGAILLKARSLLVHSRPEDQRQDLITLLGLADDPRALRDETTAKERSWLRSASDRLALDDRDLDALVDPASLRIARAAFARLTA
jgi:hypothetical protein